MSDTKILPIPFNPDWVDENGFISKAWGELDKHPDCHKLVGHIALDLQPIMVANTMESIKGVEHNLLGLFTISKKRITQTLTFRKRQIVVMPSGHRKELPNRYSISAVAHIYDKEIQVYHNVDDPRVRASLLESWTLCDIWPDGSEGDSIEKWIKNEEAIHLINNPPADAWPQSFFHLVRTVMLRLEDAWSADHREDRRAPEAVQVMNAFFKRVRKWNLSVRDKLDVPAVRRYAWIDGMDAWIDLDFDDEGLRNHYEGLMREAESYLIQGKRL
jgi:hypothetical protein